jgi:LAO/AO transport system ATPase
MMTAVQNTSDISALVGQVGQGSRAALARLLSLAAAGKQNSALAAALERLPKRPAPVIALTGSGGVGKSSLLGALTSYFAEHGERIGVLACDPQSPITGGALLGDRCRIAGATTSDRVFIRSVATAAGGQGVAQNIELMLSVMQRFGFDRIFVETVGAGQGDVTVRRFADVVVLVLQPQTGDELQWEKAGILEIADIIVVNKSDLPGADQTIADQQLHTAEGRSIPVVRTSIAQNKGLNELYQVLLATRHTPLAT